MGLGKGGGVTQHEKLGGELASRLGGSTLEEDAVRLLRSPSRDLTEHGVNPSYLGR